MKKKVLALVLAVMMAVGCFAGLGAGVMEAADYELYEQLMASTTSDEFNAIAISAAESDIKALSDSELAALQEHYDAIDLTNDSAENKATAPVTDAGPFMQAVKVTSSRAKLMAKMATALTEDNGLEFSKTASKTGDNSYTISMEAYTTGIVTTVTKTTPVDFIFVIDQSGSMDFNMKGRDTSNNSEKRITIVKELMRDFLSKTVEKTKDASGTVTTHHRIAVVGFSSKGYNNNEILTGVEFNENNKTNGAQYGSITDAQYAAALQDVSTAAGESNVNAAIDALTAKGGTQPNYGFEMAQNIFKNDKGVAGETERQRVVVFLTDGEPDDIGATGGGHDVAENAVKSAYPLKATYGATVYTIGIFNGADPSYIGATGTAMLDLNETDRANRFMNLASSNYPTADSFYLKVRDAGLFQLRWLNDVPARAEGNYYLSASNRQELENVFKTISDQVGSANIDLDGNTVIRDTVSKYFVAPENSADVKLYTADYKGSGVFADKVPAEGVTASVDGDTVSVTGFDFNANFVSENAKADGTYGKKLIIEFTVTPKDGFLGGNQVPTNDKAAVYDKDGGEVEAAASPVVDVPVAQPALSVSDKVIYEDGSVALSELYSTNEYTGENAWKADYVDITVDTGVSGSTVSPEDCTDYNIKVSYTPKNEGTENEKDVSATATVHVLKPTVTVNANDVWKYYGESYNAPDGSGITGSVAWSEKNGHDVSGIAVIGSEPYGTDDLQYSYENGSFVVPNTDTTINVVVSAKGKELTSTSYVVHPKFCTLTINKDVADLHGANDSFIFDIAYEGNVEGFTPAQVVINGAGTATLTGLPIGTYTVKEDTDWSWRYTCDNSSASTTLSASKDNDSLTITNKLTENNWLGNETFVINKCESKTIEKVSFIQQAIDFLLGR